MPYAPSRASATRWPAVVLCLAAAFLTSVARAEKGVTEGSFRDWEDKPHAWSIDPSHTLVWDGKPYAPAGVVFHSAYLSEPSETALKQDVAELERLQSAGVQDIWIEPGRGLLQNTPAQIQALVDAVESRGFRYGLRVGDRHREPLIGFSPTLTPIRVPVQKVQPGAQLSFEVRAPGSRRVLYALTEVGSDERTHHSALAVGEALVERDVARIEIQLSNSRLIGKSRGMLTVVPELQVDPDDLGSFGDLWAGMDAYSEKLRKHLRAVKFGSGLRFILDPFAAGDGTVGQEELVFPTSESFRKSFQAWLEKRGGAQTMNINWRLMDRRVQSVEEAARLVPTWSRNDPPDGDGWVLDPVEKVAFRCTPRHSSIWEDLDAFRADALKRWMNQVTTTVKRDGLDVPMLFTWSSYHPVFTNNPSPAGYDGLAAQIYGAPANVARESAAYALAQAEEADRHTWLIAARVAGPLDQKEQPTPLADAAEAGRMWDALREVGFRGIYLDPKQVRDAPAAAKALAARLASVDADLKKKVPVVFFPMALASSDRVTRLSNGVWWVPSGAPARMLRYGENMIGYDIDRPFGADHAVERGTVLWAPKGKHDVTFAVDQLTKVAFYDSAGEPIKVKVKKKEMKITVGEEPIVATGLDTTMLFPLELAVNELKELENLIKLAEAQKLDVASTKLLLTQSREYLSSGSAAAVYKIVNPQVLRLRQVLMPYVWVEGERSVSHNFSGTVFQAGASLGTYLKLDRAEKPVSGVYRARYTMDLPRDGSYEIWVAGKVPGRTGVSPLIWQVDEEPASELKTPEPKQPDYAPGLNWFFLGRMTLKAGRHELTLVVPDKADGETGRFAAAIDAVVFSREAFQPEGAHRPELKPLQRAEKGR